MRKELETEFCFLMSKTITTTKRRAQTIPTAINAVAEAESTVVLLEALSSAAVLDVCDAEVKAKDASDCTASVVVKVVTSVLEGSLVASLLINVEETVLLASVVDTEPDTTSLICDGGVLLTDSALESSLCVV